MTKDEYFKEMEGISKKLDLLLDEAAILTNTFVKENPHHCIQVDFCPIEKYTDKLCLHGAWIYDRLDDKSSHPNGPNYKRSLTKKIRKALGFNI